MPKKSVVKVFKPQSLTIGQVRQRTMNLHSNSKVVVSFTGVFGETVRASVRGIRVTMNDSGKPDFVEIQI